VEGQATALAQSAMAFAETHRPSGHLKGVIAGQAGTEAGQLINKSEQLLSGHKTGLTDGHSLAVGQLALFVAQILLPHAYGCAAGQDTGLLHLRLLD
jgi:hypothetical protein